MVVALLENPVDTYALYINEKRQINYVKANVYQRKDGPALTHFKIKERHLIVGLQYQGLTVYPLGDLKNYPLTPLERHLFNNGNINFEIAPHHFREAESLFIMYHYTSLNNVIDNTGDYFNELVSHIEETYKSGYIPPAE